MVEIVTEDESGAWDGLVREQAKGNAVLVVGVVRVGKIGRCVGRGGGEACMRGVSFGRECVICDQGKRGAEEEKIYRGNSGCGQ